jgi:DNA-binding SARP family transcriptional activator
MHRTADCTAKINILGPVAVEVPSGRPERLPGQLRKVLALLAVSREAPLSAEQIVRRVWDGEAPDSAIQMVRNHITMLRRIIGAPRGHVVEIRHGGYRLASAGLEVDAELFRDLVRRGRALGGAGEPAEAVRTLAYALGLWRGPEALADVRDVPELQVAALGLEELRFQAEEMTACGYLAIGRPQDALPILHAMTTRYPSRELPWVHLMAAQATIGRRAEASDETYRLARHHLVERTGLDAPLLARIHQAMLRGLDGEALIAMIPR